MPNNLLNSDMITNESLSILHEGLQFVGGINKQYDDSFANDGAKIGDTLRIREPNQYTVRDGATLSVQDTEEKNTSITITSQKGVDIEFSSKELALEIDRFSERYLQPAMSRLAAHVEDDCLNMYKDIYNQESNLGSATTMKNMLNGRKILIDGITPMDGNCTMLLNTQANVDLVDDLKGLFNDKTEISKNFRQGKVGKGQGFDYYESTYLGRHTTGTAAATTGYLVNGGSQTGATLTVDTGSNTFLKGDVFTIAGVYRVHPETKKVTNVLQQFVVTADSGASATSLAISPAIVASGAYQNVSGSPADNAAITKVGGASATYGISLGYHRDAFALATADLILPRGTDMASRKVFDGVSMRFIRDYDINNDKLPGRFDILYGYKTIRPQFATRVATN